MRLPGGVWTEGELRRDFAFRPMQGHVELVISESNAGLEATPLRVTSILHAALEDLGGKPPREQDIWALSVGDRQFLMRQLALKLGKDEKWFSADCSACHETFDFPIRQSELPVKDAGEGFPYVSVKTSIGDVRLHVPTGHDQAEIPQDVSTDEARLWLLQHCVEKGSGKHGESLSLSDLSDDELLRIEQAMEEVAPEIGVIVESECPVCGRANRIYLDPYAPVFDLKSQLFSQIHILAATYHWSQKEILDLPVARRLTYLSLIDQARGMVE
jgi:hypothetical protein